MKDSQIKIEKLKNKLAKHHVSMIEFHNACYSKYSNDGYKTFLDKIHYWEIWTEPMRLGFELLIEVTA